MSDSVKLATTTKDLLPAAQRYLHGYAINSVKPYPEHPDMIRVNYFSQALPKPQFRDDQWDWGDCGARAILAWIYMREMTGDMIFGKETEFGERKSLLHILSPDTGMPIVPDLSKPEEGEFYYESWDQGRTLQALVAMWLTEPDKAAKEDLRKRIDKMIFGLNQAATHGIDPKFGPYAIFPIEGGLNKPANKIPCPAAGPLIEPLVKYWAVTGDGATREFIEELLAGVFSGKEGIYSVFEEDGSFYRQFHGHTAVALGIARFGKTLYEKGETQRGLELLRWAKMVYDWIIAPSNVHSGSSWGWFPEHTGGDDLAFQDYAEICCVADMIEYAAFLANCATLDSEFEDWDALWDHVERYTFNSILPTQFKVDEEYKAALKAARASDPEQESASSLEDDLAVAERLEGGWVALFMPNELFIRESNGTIDMYTAGCCSHSAPRGLYACWKSAVADDGEMVQVRLPIYRRSDALTQTVTEGPDLVRQEIQLHQPRLLCVRIPDWADMGKVEAKDAKGNKLPFAIKGHWLQFERLESGADVCITYPLSERQSSEKVAREGNMDNSPIAEQRAYTATYRGNIVVDMQPQVDILSVFRAG